MEDEGKSGLPGTSRLFVASTRSSGGVVPLAVRINSMKYWKRAFISLGVLAVCFAARPLPLPAVPPNVYFADGSMAVWSIMALGVGPLLSGYMLVEFAALIVPAWRPLRVGGPAGRAKLHRAALITGMVLALPQAVVF